MVTGEAHWDFLSGGFSRQVIVQGGVALIAGNGIHVGAVDGMVLAKGIRKATMIAFAETSAKVALLSRIKSQLEEALAEGEKFDVTTLILPSV